jgi:uncharacterized protein YndB with AHSA1/START domain
MTPKTIQALTVRRTIAADPQRVFDAWTQPAHMVNWACPEGATLDTVRTDIRVGGSYLLKMTNPEGETYTAFGTYREVDPPHRLVYTWDWKEEAHRMGETLVTVEFIDRDGATEVVLRHEGFPSTEAREGHDQGWASCLDKLVAMFA